MERRDRWAGCSVCKWKILSITKFDEIIQQKALSPGAAPPPPGPPAPGPPAPPRAAGPRARPGGGGGGGGPRVEHHIRLRKGICAVKIYVFKFKITIWGGGGRLKGDGRRKNWLIESNAKCRYLKKLICKGGVCGSCLSVWGPLPLLAFCLGSKAIL